MSDPVPTREAVRRFTTEYIAAEDRIRIALERRDESLLVLWLTRRLAVRLVPQIVRVIDALPRLTGKAETRAPRRSQLEAVGKLEQQDPVLAGELPGDLDSYLIGSLGVRLTRMAILVDFKTAEGAVVETLPFSEDAIRQWLSVLHLNFRKGRWGDDVWPEWITAKGGERGPDAVRLH